MPIDESLDIPPPLPSVNEFPDYKFGEKLPKGGFPAFEFKEDNPMPAAEEIFPELPKENEPELRIPSFPEMEDTPKFMPKPPIKESTNYLPKEKLIKPEEHGLRKPFEEHKEAVKKRIVRKGPLYIKLEKFKEVVGDVNLIKKDLKKSGELLDGVISLKEEKAQDFEKWHIMVEDIQKKIVFIEKTLFKGK
ncbi:hypothetical protein ISS05_03945 [Candidatus Woesearchaeota archaeon]|nr:hypothetical protein [Candidatus Woesearchaeota archaeon]